MSITTESALALLRPVVFHLTPQQHEMLAKALKLYGLQRGRAGSRGQAVQAIAAAAIRNQRHGRRRPRSTHLD